MYESLITMIKESSSIVFFGGAGVSTESGIPDFRSHDGLWHTKTKYHCTPEEVVSHTFYKRHPEEFYEFYFERMIFPDVKPNITHTVLAELEAIGKLKAIVTQNIDSLHQLAGSKTVYELHGSVQRYFCQSCHAPYDLAYALDKTHRAEGSFLPRCSCGGVLKPDVVLFEEGLDQEVIEGAVNAIRQADMLIVGGTSLVVYPAAGLINYYRGNKLVLINRDETAYDKQANLVIHDSLGKVFQAIKEGGYTK